VTFKTVPFFTVPQSDVQNSKGIAKTTSYLPKEKQYCNYKTTSTSDVLKTTKTTSYLYKEKQYCNCKTTSTCDVFKTAKTTKNFSKGVLVITWYRTSF